MQINGKICYPHVKGLQIPQAFICDLKDRRKYHPPKYTTFFLQMIYVHCAHDHYHRIYSVKEGKETSDQIVICCSSFAANLSSWHYSTVVLLAHKCFCSVNNWIIKSHMEQIANQFVKITALFALLTLYVMNFMHDSKGLCMPLDTNSLC